MLAGTNYLGVSGTNAEARDGLFTANMRMRLLDVLDGTSNTLMVGERGFRKGALDVIDTSADINNLHQIGLALHNYHDANGAFPPAHDTQFYPQYYWSWLARILPYIEQDNLYRQAELWRDGGPPDNLRWATWYTANGTQPQNPTLAAVVPMYVCPLDEVTHQPQLGHY